MSNTISKPDTDANRNQLVMVASITSGLIGMGSHTELYDQPNGDIWIVNEKLDYVIIVDQDCDAREEVYSTFMKGRSEQ